MLCSEFQVKCSNWTLHSPEANGGDVKVKSLEERRKSDRERQAKCRNKKLEKEFYDEFSKLKTMREGAEWMRMRRINQWKPPLKDMEAIWRELHGDCESRQGCE